jgi:hypothetical protein
LQISASNLLVAGQQAMRPGTAQPVSTAATKPEFAALDFKQMLQQPAAASVAPAATQTAPAQSFQRIGSQLDIRV